MTQRVRPGAHVLADGSCRFTVWAPSADGVELHLHTPRERRIRMQRGERGYHEATVADVPVGTLYTYVLNRSKELPDPASRYQPEGVHGPSEVYPASYAWADNFWHGIPLKDYIIYELHVGTFTEEGTFDAIIPHLEDLAGLGITAVELMPVAQFPGTRNWGYDGAYPYAAQNSYGGPAALKRLVDACHQHGLAAILDVVYNHFGPEGNYAGDYGPYFTDRYHTPWGRAMNFDGAGSDEVRAFFIGNALQWLDEFHFDALRLDALHAILDISPIPFLQELSETVAVLRASTGRFLYLIGESDLNDPRLIRPRDKGGIGLDAQWNDDFHHALHVTLTSENKGYYEDFRVVEDLARAMQRGYVYTGQYSTYRDRRHGAPTDDLPPERFVVCAQNHDQVGNRKAGDRLATLTTFEQRKFAAAAVLLSPYVPLLFMGEEYGETAPFPYFVSHSDKALVDAVRKGRAAEFSAFDWEGELPDPQSESTFRSAFLDRTAGHTGANRTLLHLYTELIRLRKAVPPLTCVAADRNETTVSLNGTIITVLMGASPYQTALLLNCGNQHESAALALPDGDWKTELDTAHARWNGPGSDTAPHIRSSGGVTISLSPWSAMLLTKGRTY